MRVSSLVRTLLAILGGDHVVEHGPGEEEGDVRVDVELGQQLLNRGQPRSVIILEQNICLLNLIYPYPYLDNVPETC